MPMYCNAMEVFMTCNFSVRMDSEVKNQSEAIFNELGLNLTTAINVFLRKSIQSGGFPFDVRLDEPSKDLLMAVQEAENISQEILSGQRKPFDSWEEAKKSLMQ